MNILNNLDTIITNILNSLGAVGPLLGCFLIIIESMVPILPLSVFITLNFYAFGQILGFIISYLFTILGCYISYSLVKHNLKGPFDRYLDSKEHKQLNKLKKIFNTIKLENLVLLIALPFTPAFMINIAAGLSEMSKKKYLTALAIGKIFLVYFWGYVGVTLIDSIKHPIYLLKILVLMLIAYILSKLINKKTGVE